jgi:hypothetical protein
VEQPELDSGRFFIYYFSSSSDSGILSPSLLISESFLALFAILHRPRSPSHRHHAEQTKFPFNSLARGVEEKKGAKRGSEKREKFCAEIFSDSREKKIKEIREMLRNFNHVIRTQSGARSKN